MIGMTGENRHGPVDLLGQEDAHEEMRPGRGAEGERKRRAAPDQGAVAVGTADQEARGRSPLVAQRRQAAGEARARKVVAALVERDQSGAFGAGGEERRGLLVAPERRFPALVDLDELEAAEAAARR